MIASVREIGAVVMCLVLLLQSVAIAAQQEPKSINSLTRLSGSPTPAQRQQIEAYAEYWGGELGSSDPDRCGEASNRLKQPLSAPGVSRPFRLAYSKALIDALETAVAVKNSPMGTANAMIVLGRLGTEDGLDVIIAHCANVKEDRKAVRLRAARAYLTAVQRGQPDGTISNRKVTPALRAMGRAAAAEPDWDVMRAQFKAILATTGTKTSEVRDDTFDQIMDRLEAQDEPSPMILAIRPALVHMRNEFRDAPPATQRVLARSIVPQLERALEVAGRHWPNKDESPALWAAYGDIVEICETTLQFIDSTLGNHIGSSSLGQHYQRMARPEYTAEFERIQAIIHQQPYK